MRLLKPEGHRNNPIADAIHRLACGRDLWTNAEAAVSGIGDADAKWEAQQYIQTSPTVARNHPLVIQLASALGKTAEEVDAIFAAAAILDTPS